MKSLRSTGSCTARARLAQELVLALEVGLVGQHRQAGRAAALVGAGERRRVEVGADQALAGRGLLDLGDQAVAAGGDGGLRAPWRSRAADRRRAPAPRPSRQRALRLAAGDVLALVGADLGERCRSCADPLADVGERVRRAALPLSIDCDGERRALLAGRRPCRRPSAPPALFSTHDVAEGVLLAAQHARGSPRRCAPASPPLSSASGARCTPTSSGAISISRTLPSSSEAAQLSVVVVSSSMPSWPCTTQARSSPSWPSASATGFSQRRSNTPTSWRLHRGRVRHRAQQVEDRAGGPSSTRGPATLRMALWWRGAIRKQMPASTSACSSVSIGSSMLMPSAVSTSAAPDLEVKARLPCLATGTPAPATTKAEQVETL